MATTPPPEEQPQGFVPTKEETDLLATQEQERLAAEGKAPEVDPNAPKPEDRPEGLPEGFDTWEAYAKNLAEEKAKAPAPQETPEQKTQREALEAKTAPYSAELVEKGELSPESITKAAKEFGVSEDMVRDYVEAQKAKLATAGTQVDPLTLPENKPLIDAVGGDWGKFSEWTKTGLTDAERATLNKSLAGTDRDVAALAMAPFAERFKSDGGANPPSTLTRTPGTSAPGSDVFGSMDEQVEAQRDARYASSPSYRAQVDAKIGRSTGY